MRPDYPNARRRATAPPPGRALQARLALAALVLGLCPAARAEDAPAALTGTAAWERILGNTVSGTTPDGPYDEVFAPGGRLTIVDGDGKADGTWRWQGDRLCTRVDGEDEDECRTVSVTGAAGAFTDSAGSRYPFEIRPGNPKGL